jgi:hypothetical protein
MGTDIHLYIERQADDGTWSRVQPAVWTCPWCHGEGAYKNGHKCYFCEGVGKSAKEYHNRNYDLFAMLADVRNGSGFAGCDTGDGFEILAKPRGLPADTSIRDTIVPDDEDYSERPDYVWLGDHSFSHCTLAEVLAYDYDRTTKHRGVVDAAEYSAWVEVGRKSPPKSYSGGVMGLGVKTVDQSTMDHLIRSGVVKTITKTEFGPPKSEDGIAYYTTVEWEESYRDCAGKSWFEFLEACKPLGDPERIRFVFGFDS